MTAPERPRRRGSLRVRVALAAAGAIVVAVSVLGAGVQMLLSNHLHAELDSTLRERAAQIAQLSATAPALLTSPGVLDVSAGPRLIDVEVVDRRRRIVARSLGAPGRDDPGRTRWSPRPSRAAASGYGDAHLRGADVRRLRRAALRPGRARGRRRGDRRRVDRRRRATRSSSRARLIIGGALLAAALAFPLSLVLARRALRPLERLSAGAAVIEQHERRIAPPARGRPPRRRRGRPARRDAERMLAALERAREAERRFVADASHELRNPITALRGNAAYLLAHGADPETLADIHADAERLSRLLDDLLALAREDAGAVPDEPVDVAELAREAADGEAGVVVEADGPGPRARRPAARSSGRSGTSSRTPIATALRAARCSVTVESAPATVVLAVTDSGEGIPPHLAEAATGRFWRGPDADAAGGSGLGLALVRATAERHGGKLVIDGPGLRSSSPLSGRSQAVEGDTADADRRRAP